jgi:hypothetical protein
MFDRFHAQYTCGCMFYNDQWRDVNDIDQLCPKHNENIDFSSFESAIGIRPEQSKIEHSKKMFGVTNSQRWQALIIKNQVKH